MAYQAGTEEVEITLLVQRKSFIIEMIKTEISEGKKNSIHKFKFIHFDKGLKLLKESLHIKVGGVR